jgi:hypothetical protein
MGTNYVGVGDYLFTIEGVFDENQHWNGESYPWTLNTYLRIEGQIGNTSQNI